MGSYPVVLPDNLHTFPNIFTHHVFSVHVGKCLEVSPRHVSPTSLSCCNLLLMCSVASQEKAEAEKILVVKVSEIGW